jgi:hypothetical protein
MREAYFGSLDKAFEGFTFVDDSAMGLMQKGLEKSEISAALESSNGHAYNGSAISSSINRSSFTSSLPKSGAGATMLATSLKKSTFR